MERVVEIKPPVEVRYARELRALRALDTGKRPRNWKMSPQAVRTFLLGSHKPLIWEGEEIPVRLWDERQTTMQAAEYLNETNVRGKKRKEIIDEVAATIILESYLNYRHHQAASSD